MKINGVGGSNFVQGNNRANKVSAHEKYNAISREDKILISDEAISFSRVLSAARQDAEVREADVKSRIETIREQIENGTYNVSSEELAESIIGEIYY